MAMRQASIDANTSRDASASRADAGLNALKVLVRLLARQAAAELWQAQLDPPASSAPTSVHHNSH
jgi:hypothetical protein